MAIFKRFSKRANGPDIPLPRDLRVQVVFIMVETAGAWTGSYTPPNPVWDSTYRQILKEKAQFYLSDKGRKNGMEQLIAFLEQATDADAIDLVDLFFQTQTRYQSNQAGPWTTDGFSQQAGSHVLSGHYRAEASLSDGIEELNGRFLEHEVPLQFTSGRLIRTDSEYLYEEATEPAFNLLRTQAFRGAEDEFRTAHEHFRKGRWDSAVSEANQAVESVMKQLLTMEKVPFEPSDAVTKLSTKVLASKVFAHVDAEYRSKLHAALTTKLPPVRNAIDHGGGVEPRKADEAIAAFALHLAASDIVFLVTTWQLYRER